MDLKNNEITANDNRSKKEIFLFLISQNLSMFGSSVVGFSIIWYITLKTSSGSWITISTIAALTPQIFISLWAGVVADRYSRKMIIMLSDGFTALATIAAFAAFHAGFQSPAVNALDPQIVPADQLVRINGINQTLNNILLLISPAVGGFILGTMGIKWTFLIDVSTALLAIVIIAAIRVKAQPRKTAPNGSIIAELKSGVRYTLDNPLLKTITICCAVSFILITPAAFLSPLMVARNFGGEVWRLTANEILYRLEGRFPRQGGCDRRFARGLWHNFHIDGAHKNILGIPGPRLRRGDISSLYDHGADGADTDKHRRKLHGPRLFPPAVRISGRHAAGNPLFRTAGRSG